MKTYNRLQAAFPGTEIPANVVVKAADVNSTEIRNAIGELERRAVATGLMQQPIIVDVNEAGTVANVAVPIAGKGNDGPSNAALAALRDEIVPATIGAVPDTEVAVGGFAAESKDFNDYMKSVVWFVFAFVLGFAFLILLFAFRSLVIAAKAIVLNLLSVAAAYGILVLVFQHGWGKQLLGFESTGGIVPVPPDLPVRDPVRALDGLPRVHPEPHQRGLRPRRDHRRRPCPTGSRRPRASSRAQRS